MPWRGIAAHRIMRRMMSGRVLALTTAVWLSSCGGSDALLQDATGRYRLVARSTAPTEQVFEPAREHPGAVVAFAHDWRTGAAARTMVRPKHGLADGYAIVVDASSDVAPPEDRHDAFVVPDTGAAVAIELALLHCHGQSLPRHLPLGASILLPGGRSQRQPAPGNYVLELLHRQHAELLTTTPRLDVVFRLGFVRLAEDDAFRRATGEAAAAAARFPQLDLVRRTGDGTAATQLRLGRELLAEGCRALLVVSDDPPELAPLAAACAEQRAALILVDADRVCEHATCTVGADAEMLGRAGGEAVKVLAPNGAELFEFAVDLTAERSQRIQRGFATALGLH